MCACTHIPTSANIYTNWNTKECYNPLIDFTARKSYSYKNLVAESLSEHLININPSASDSYTPELAK